MFLKEIYLSKEEEKKIPTKKERAEDAHQPAQFGGSPDKSSAGPSAAPTRAGSPPSRVTTPPI